MSCGSKLSHHSGARDGQVRHVDQHIAGETTGRKLEHPQTQHRGRQADDHGIPSPAVRERGKLPFNATRQLGVSSAEARKYLDNQYQSRRERFS